jgi:hypothetical protein
MSGEYEGEGWASRSVPHRAAAAGLEPPYPPSAARRCAWFAIFALAALLLAAPARASLQVPPNAPGQYAPRDECADIAGTASFLSALRSAVKKRDAGAVAALASPDIFLDFGSGGRKEEVRARLGPGSRLWRELDRLMALGCAVDSQTGALVMPWFFAQDLGGADPYSTAVTLGSAVALRTRPSRAAKVRARLNWQLIHIQETEVSDPGFVTAAVIGGGSEGYIEEAKLRTQLDYRLRAEKIGGRWLIMAFLAGD